jgi:hypothetical protein
MDANSTLELIKFLTAVATCTDGNRDFETALKNTTVVTSEEGVQAALHQLASVPPAHFAAVMTTMSKPNRETLHAHALHLSSEVAKAMPHMSHDVTMLRLLMHNILPALRNLPEDSELATSALMAKDYKSAEYVAHLIKPEDTTQTSQLQSEVSQRGAALNTCMQQQSNLAAQNKGLSDKVATYEARLRTFGAAPNGDAAADTKQLESLKNHGSSSTTVTVLAVVLAIVALAAIVFAVLYFRKKSAKNSGDATPGQPKRSWFENKMRGTFGPGQFGGRQQQAVNPQPNGAVYDSQFWGLEE